MKIGIDSVEVERMEKLINERKNLEKIFSSHELNNIKNCSHSSQRASGYFAVKEAFSKALGTGFNGEFSLIDICVCYNKNGAPQIQQTDVVVGLLKKYGFSKCEISITHTKTVATAICVLE